MFDKGQGQKALTDEVDRRSDEFAALFDDLTPRQQLVFLEKANLLLVDPDSVDAFNSGTYAQNSNGQPAAALGSGSSGGAPVPADLQQALQVIGADSRVTPGMMTAVGRVLSDPNDAGHMAVEPDGTPTELKNARTERDNAKTAKDAAEKELREQKDENHTGSLAQKLRDALAAPPAPAGTVNKAAVKAQVDHLAGLANAKKSMVKSADAVVPATDADVLKAAQAELVRLVS